MKKLILSIFVTFCLFSIFSQSNISNEPHQSIVTDIKNGTSTGEFDSVYFSAGEDGFLIKWTDDNNGEHYQITDVGIKLIAVSPTGNEIAVYETDGGSVNKVSIWDWKNLVRIKQFKYTDSITSLSFSAKGTYLIIGTATVDGAVFIRTSNWTVVDKIKTNTSIVNYICTSSTEKNCVLYSPTGNLSYYNLGTGQLKEKFSVPQGLTQCTMFNNNIFFTGVKDNTIYVINAFKGTTVSTIPCQNPIILSNSNDSNLYYLEYDGRNLYELKMLENLEKNTVSNPRVVKTLKGPRGNSSINTGCKFNSEIVLGSKTGSIYKIDTDPSLSVTNINEITQNIYSKILDISSSDSNLYFITKNSICKTSYDSSGAEKNVERVFDNNGNTQFISLSDKELILWSNYTKNPVNLINLETKEIKTLFTPKNNVQSIKLSVINGINYLTEIESNSLVNIYNFATNSYSEAYAGTGIQDAILSENGLYIAKSASTNPKTPLICMNISTMETVPLNIKGNVAFGLSYLGNNLYGINLVSDDSGESTYVFSYNTNSKQFVNILKFANEDSDAFTYVSNSSLYTNIGKNKIYCYNINNKKYFPYNRAASIPIKIVQNQNKVVILNNDGSISWCNDNGKQILSNWYLDYSEKYFK